MALVVALVSCGGGSSSEGSNGSGGATSATQARDVSSAGSVPDDRAPTFVLPEGDGLTLVDARRAPDTATGPELTTFAKEGSPHDDAAGPRVEFAVFDGSGLLAGGELPPGEPIDVDGRQFVWTSEGEGQRSYLGPTPNGSTVGMSTLNVDESTAVDLLASMEVVDGTVSFDGQEAPTGWVPTGTSTTVIQFIGGATGASAPPEGIQLLYTTEAGGTPGSAQPSGVTLSSWNVASSSPDSEARQSLDGEVVVEIPADAGPITGYASAPGSPYSYVIWRDGNTWLALSSMEHPVATLTEMATTVRPATPDESDRIDTLAAN